MAQQVNWSFLVEAVGGPRLGGSGRLDVDAYDSVHVDIAAGATTAVAILPGQSPDVTLLVIHPRSPSPHLTYDVGGSAVPLDGPHVLIGAGAVKLLAADVGSLTFKNDTGADAGIDILVGRTAV
jgi:hypothetical protein